MSTAALLADLEARGVRLTAVGSRLRVDAPRGALTAADREALVAHKAALLAALRAEVFRRRTTAADAWDNGVPDSSCGLCGSPLAWVTDWPTAGDARWLCLRCAAQPAPSLRAVFATLTPEERQRLADERDAGDPLGAIVCGARGDRR